MNRFGTIREAKDFLAGRIAAEAKRENIPLSEVERKMLYFTETGWTLPDMAEVSAEFDRDYGQDEYEQKIASLVRKIEKDDQVHPNDQEAWDDAVLKLSEGDHYLLVLVNPSLSASGPTVRPPHDGLMLWLTAFGIIFGLFVLASLCNWLFGARFWTVMGWVFGDRNRFGLIVVAAVLIWLFRVPLKDILSALMKRK